VINIFLIHSTEIVTYYINNLIIDLFSILILINSLDLPRAFGKFINYQRELYV